MICFMFPGQPMARTDLPASDPLFLDMAACCRNASGFNPLADDGDTAGLNESVKLQLYGVTMSLCRHELLLRQYGRPDLIAEHSLGIYPALAACGSISSLDALEMTGRIGLCLATMGAGREYALGSVIGLTFDPLESIVTRHGVFIANRNTSHHFLLAGERDKVRAATLEAEAAGAFSVGVFPCDAPLHTPLVAEISADLRRIVADYSFREPSIPLVEHIGQKELSATDMPAFLVDQLCCPVFWEQTYRTLRARGGQRFLEVGHGMALTKFNRWIDSQS